MRVPSTLWLGVLAFGCQGKPENSTSGKLGAERRQGPAPTALKPVAYELAIEKPQSGIFEPGKPITCLVQLNMPTGERPPSRCRYVS